MKRLTYDFVKESFEKEGYELLSEEYVDSKTKLDYRCPKGHERNTTWAMWQQNRRCSICSREKGIAKRRVSLKFIKSQFEKEGYELLSKKYTNAHTKLRYRCPKGHEHDVVWGHWQQKRRCPYCARKKKLTIEFIRFEFAKEGYKLLTKIYKNAFQKLYYICSNGHNHYIVWGSWQQGNRCPYCVNLGKPTIEFIKSEFKKEKYILLTTEYKNCLQKLEYICPRGHKHSINWSGWQQGHRCSYCVNIISKGEVEVRNFIKSLDIEVSANNRSQIFNPETGYGLELDIFMPEFGKAIEYNGEYWHRDKSRDLFKQQLCESRGINLLTIWDKEWKTQKNVCEEKIMKFVFNNERGV